MFLVKFYEKGNVIWVNVMVKVVKFDELEVLIGFEFREIKVKIKVKVRVY